MLGSASLTTPASRMTMNWATATTPSTAFRLTRDVRGTEMASAEDMRISLRLDACCAGERRRQERSGSVQCSARFVEDRVIGLEGVGHPSGDVERDLDVCEGGLSREADGGGAGNPVASRPGGTR